MTNTELTFDQLTAISGQDSAAQWNTSPLVPETDDIPF